MACASSIDQLTNEDGKMSKSQPLKIPSKVHHSQKPMQSSPQQAQQHQQTVQGSTLRTQVDRDVDTKHHLQHQGDSMGR